MLFSTPIFIFLFLPLVLLTYYATPKKYRNIILLLSSIFFYTWGEQEFVLLILASTLIDYSAGLIIERGFRKTGLIVSLSFNLFALFYFKYGIFFIESLQHILNNLGVQKSINSNLFITTALPLGISFYTFQTMSYTIDAYVGKIKPTRNIINFATYVTLFPQLIAGPIIKYKDIESQLKKRNENITQFNEGINRFIMGLAKKVLIANQVSLLSDGIFNLPTSNLSMPLAWIGALTYSIQIYFDFSGYSDMAIGLAKMFGFTIPENFNYPYKAKSIQEFWRRWHISLSSWFKEYVYIPLGGNRINSKRTLLNLSLVFLATGVWHGANWTFIVWGLIHGLLIITEKLGFHKVLSKNKILAHTYTLIAVITSWVIFRSPSLKSSFEYISKMFSFNFTVDIEILSYYTNTETILAIFLGIMLSFPVFNKVNLNKEYIRSFLIFSLFILSIIYVSIGAYNPFIYFNF